MPDVNHKDPAGIVPVSREIEQSLERRDIAFEALFRLFEKIGTTFDLDTIIKLLLMTIVGQLGLRRVAFFLREEASSKLELYHSIGMNRDTEFPTFSIESSFIKWVDRNDGVVMIDDFFKSERTGYKDDRTIGEELVKCGFSYVSDLKEGDQLVGIMAFSKKVSGHGFSRFDRELLIMMARVAAITIRNATLYQSVLKSRDELENFSRMKKEFIDHTSHELRTPITVLRSSLWSIDADEDDAMLMEMARDSVLRLEEKVENILTLNEMDINGAFIEPLVVEISGLVIGSCREVSEDLEEREIILDIINGIGERYISIDPSRIKIAIHSLIQNAVSSIDCKGTIRVKLSECRVDPGSQDGIEILAWESKEGEPDRNAADGNSGASWLVVRIIDNGVGIPEKEISAIGRPFVRASNSTVGEVKGLGLGLSMSQKIVAAHGGHIFCKSIENEGAEFSIWLPEL